MRSNGKFSRSILLRMGSLGLLQQTIRTHFHAILSFKSPSFEDENVLEKLYLTNYSIIDFLFLAAFVNLRVNFPLLKQCERHREAHGRARKTSLIEFKVTCRNAGSKEQKVKNFVYSVKDDKEDLIDFDSWSILINFLTNIETTETIDVFDELSFRIYVRDRFTLSKSKGSFWSRCSQSNETFRTMNRLWFLTYSSLSSYSPLSSGRFIDHILCDQTHSPRQDIKTSPQSIISIQAKFIETKLNDWSLHLLKTLDALNDQLLSLIFHWTEIVQVEYALSWKTMNVKAAGDIFESCARWLSWVFLDLIVINYFRLNSIEFQRSHELNRAE